MIRTILACAAIFLASSFAPARAGDEAELKRISDAWDQAIVAKDADAVAANMADDFRIIHSRRRAAVGHHAHDRQRRRREVRRALPLHRRLREARREVADRQRADHEVPGVKHAWPAKLATLRKRARRVGSSAAHASSIAPRQRPGGSGKPCSRNARTPGVSSARRLSGENLRGSMRTFFAVPAPSFSICRCSSGSVSLRTRS
jgi:hypothetical protein